MKGYHIILLLLLLVSCVDEITIDLPENQENVKVVEGYVERDSFHYFIWAQVSETQSVTGPFQPMPRDAIVYLIYNGNQNIQIPTGQIVKMSISEFHDTYGGTPEGAKFQLLVEVEGQSYRSEEQVMIETPKPDTITVETESRMELNEFNNIFENPYVKIFVHTPLENSMGERVNFIWQLFSDFEFIEGTRSDPFYTPKRCYVPYNAIFRNDVNVASSADFSGRSNIDGFEIGEMVNDYRFSLKLVFTVVQKSLNANSLKYWQEVKASNEREGSLFDVYPGRIRTNIQNENNPDEEIHGFFHVSAVDTLRVSVSPREIPNAPIQRCSLWEEPDIISPDDPDPCLDCLNFSGATLTAPHYWNR